MTVYLLWWRRSARSVRKTLDIKLRLTLSNKALFIEKKSSSDCAVELLLQVLNGVLQRNSNSRSDWCSACGIYLNF
jgi:hypothetical protein